MTTPRDLLAEGCVLRAFADHEQATADPSKPWVHTNEWHVWARRNAGALLDLVDALLAADPDLSDRERIDPHDGWEYDLSEAAYETYGGAGRRLREAYLEALDTPTGTRTTVDD